MAPKFQRKITREDLIAIVANLIPVYGVWFLNWSAVEVFIVYALETLIVGILTLLKLGVMTVHRKTDNWYNESVTTQVSGIFFLVFFSLHFGLFAAVQSTIFAESASINPPGKGMMYFFFHWYEYINKDVGIMLGAFVVSYLVRSFLPFITTGEYKRISMMRVMFQPYGRIFIQQFTVILGSMLLAFGWGKGFILVFALAKILFEVYFNFDSIIERTMTGMEQQPGTSTHDNQQ